MVADMDLRKGATAYDSTRQRYARVVEVETSRVALRPLGGGREWWADRVHVRPATAGETLSARLGEAGTSTRYREVM